MIGDLALAEGHEYWQHWIRVHIGAGHELVMIVATLKDESVVKK